MTPILGQVVLAMTARGGFDVIMAVLVVMGLIGGVIKGWGGWTEHNASDRFWGVLSGIGIAVTLPILWAIMASAGWTPSVTSGGGQLTLLTTQTIQYLV